METILNLIITNPLPITLWIAVGIASYYLFIDHEKRQKSGNLPKILFVLIAPIITIPCLGIIIYKYFSSH